MLIHFYEELLEPIYNKDKVNYCIFQNPIENFLLIIDVSDICLYSIQVQNLFHVQVLYFRIIFKAIEMVDLL